MYTEFLEKRRNLTRKLSICLYIDRLLSILGHVQDWYLELLHKNTNGYFTAEWINVALNLFRIQEQTSKLNFFSTFSFCISFGIVDLR